jgi:hypothetical protein
MSDRNKSQLTHDVTNAVAAWMDERGFKPVESEVGPLSYDSNKTGWIADLAGVICPTQTELIELKLLRPRPSWRAPSQDQEAWRASYSALDRVMTALVEVKTSRRDFVGDRKWLLTPPTDLAFLAVPSAMIRQEEWPSGWGILSCADGSVRRLRPPTPSRTTAEQQLGVVLAIATRRDHHTRYARLREFQREQRLQEGEEKTILRAGYIARAFLQIARGEHNSVEEVLDRHRLKRLPFYVMDDLRQLWGIMAESALKEEEAIA